MVPDIRIRPLRVGTLLGRDMSLLTYMSNIGTKLDVPIIMWYLEGASRRILVDTGTASPEYVDRNPHHHPYRRTEMEDPVNVLAQLGVEPDDIDVVINTHLHWDHCSNNHLFHNAVFIVQREELRFAAAPLPNHAGIYDALTAGMSPPFANCRNYRAIVGDAEVVPGVRVLFTPGHTPGSQSVVVDTRDGPYLIAGDTVPLYANVSGDKLIPHAIHVDLGEYYETLSRLTGMGFHILPGHDPAVLERTVFP